MKYYSHDLKQSIDGIRWISDDRISACLDRRSGWITQVDFHGLQPVSRNAKLLAHNDGVFQFFIENENQSVPLS
ncbi:hypothetical protein KAH55_13800, partial [bacterium]|nr:hypothetical protein [bacterium]